MDAFRIYSRLDKDAVAAAHVHNIHRGVRALFFDDSDDDDGSSSDDGDRGGGGGGFDDEPPCEDGESGGEKSGAGAAGADRRWGRRDEDEERAMDNAGVELLLDWPLPPPGPLLAASITPATVVIPASTRRVSRAQRYNQAAPGSSSRKSTLTAHGNLLAHAAIRSELRRWWKRLCAEAMIDPSDPQKVVRVRVWCQFFRRLSHVLPDWDPDENALLPGKSPTKLSFSEDEFSEFIFHDILAPRCAFAQQHSPYISLARQLYALVFDPELRSWDGNSQHAHLQYQQRNKQSSSTNTNNNTNSNNSISSSNSAGATSPLILSSSSSAGTHRVRRTTSNSFQPANPVPTAAELAARAEALAVASRARAAMERAAMEAQAAMERAAVEAAEAVAREKKCNQLAETYCMLVGRGSLLQLDARMRHLMFVQAELEKFKRPAGGGRRSLGHRLQADLLVSDKLDAERTLRAWASETPSHRVWAKDAANLLLKKVRRGQTIRSSADIDAARSRRHRENLTRQRPPSRNGGRRGGSRDGGNNSEAASVNDVVCSLQEYGSSASAQDLLEWARRCHRIYVERFESLFRSGDLNMAMAEVVDPKNVKNSAAAGLSPAPEHLFGMQHILQKILCGRYSGESVSTALTHRVPAASTNRPPTARSMWLSEDSGAEAPEDIALGVTQLSFVLGGDYRSGSVKGFGISKIPALSTSLQVENRAKEGAHDIDYHHKLHYSVSGEFEWITRSASVVLRAGQDSSGRRHGTGVGGAVFDANVLVFPHHVVLRLVLAPVEEKEKEIENGKRKDDAAKRMRVSRSGSAGSSSSSSGSGTVKYGVLLRRYREDISLSALKDIVMLQRERQELQRLRAAARFPVAKVPRLKVCEYISAGHRSRFDASRSTQNDVQGGGNRHKKAAAPRPSPGTVAANLEAFVLAEERAKRQTQLRRHRNKPSPVQSSVDFRKNLLANRSRIASQRERSGRKALASQRIAGVKGSAKELKRLVNAVPPTSLPSSSPPSPRSMIMLRKRPASRSGGELGRRRERRAATLRGGSGGRGGGKRGGGASASATQMKNGLWHVHTNKLAGSPHFDARGTTFKQGARKSTGGKPMRARGDRNKTPYRSTFGGHTAR
jgi:hypothetical protein